MKRLSAIFLFLLIPNFAFSKPINIYIRLDNPKLHEAVSALNNELKQLGFFKRYSFEPFLNQYPMHATLYLAEYETNRVSEIVKRAKQFACSSSPVQLEITGLSLTASNYLMLEVNNTLMPQNRLLQQLSDKATLMFSDLRDYHAPIPDWAKSISSKRKAFAHYGSPNVFFLFNPHLSLMAPVLSPEKSQAFQREIEPVLKAWHVPKLILKSAVLGIGYTNEQGQITKEIARFNLASCKK